MTEGEKCIFRHVIFGSLMSGGATGCMAYILVSSSLMTAAAFLVLFGLLFCMFWFFQASMDSFRDYGLGEGIANLYGEERAKMMFGDDYKKPESSNE